ncbi:MAG: phosphate/phosphite/phosphonate ABC transporter substrate-binding protein [Deltaproteobacteria bacterium]|nr:phosphate/phosphite/phosphonate ABC transporter substrate-binding protein [Deltaproteobacteria bacterium]
MKTGLSAVLLTICLLAGAVNAHSQDVLVLGVAPHTSARVILEMYQPLRLYLEKTLGMPVEVVTAPDFTQFARRALHQDYDIAITTGHQARLLQTDARYLSLLTYKADFKAVAIVAVTNPIRKPSELQGKNILGLSPSSLVTLWGQHWMVDNGLATTKIKYVSASDSVAQLILAGEAVVGFTSLANFQKLQPDVKKQLRILAESSAMPGRVYMLNSKRSGMKKRIDRALWDFAATPEAQRYFEVNKLEGYRKLGAKELATLDKYAAEVRSVLKREEK